MRYLIPLRTAVAATPVTRVRDASASSPRRSPPSGSSDGARRRCGAARAPSYERRSPLGRCLLAALAAGGVGATGAAGAEPPPDYAANLELIRSSSPRNANHDASPWRNTPQRDLARANHLGPRSDYLGPERFGGIIDGGKENHFPDAGGGQFRVSCEFSHFAYDDPIVHPGKPGAAHLHMFWGNTDVNAYSTYDTLVNSGSSTCNGQELNRTGYWAPAMFDAAGNVRVPMRIVVYYKGYGLARGRSAVYPKGAAMIADDLHAVPDSRGGVSGEKTFQCSNTFRGGRSPQGNTIPVCRGERQIVSTLEMHVKFPNCLVGDDPSDPGSWSTSLAGSWYWSDCGDGLTTPNIEYIIQYPLGDGETTEGWYLASDVNPTRRVRDVAPGSTTHADWWGGWEPGINREWLDECANYDNGDVPSGCGFGYLSDGGPDNRAPLPGPALKLRPGYDRGWTGWGQLLDPSAGDYKVPAASLYEQLCPGGERIDSAAAAAYCRPAGHGGHGGEGGHGGRGAHGAQDGPGGAGGTPGEPSGPSKPSGPSEPARPSEPFEPDDVVGALPRGRGLRATYFDDEFYGAEAGSRIDPRIAFDFGRNGLPPDSGVTAPDTFSVQWRGYLLPDRSETVTLWTRSDDGVRVYLDGELVIDNWSDHAPTLDRARVTLEGGRAHAIAVQYYQRRGGAQIRLGWRRDGRGSGAIAARYLHPDYPL